MAPGALTRRIFVLLLSLDRSVPRRRLLSLRLRLWPGAGPEVAVGGDGGPALAPGPPLARCCVGCGLWVVDGGLWVAVGSIKRNKKKGEDVWAILFLAWAGWLFPLILYSQTAYW